MYRFQLVLALGDGGDQDEGFWTTIDWAKFKNTVSLFPKLENISLHFATESDITKYVANGKLYGFDMEDPENKHTLSYSIMFGGRPVDWPSGIYMAKVRC